LEKPVAHAGLATSSQAQDGFVFPFPLTPFETKFVELAPPGGRIDLILRAEFDQPLSRSDWEQACRTVLPRHPLLQATIRPTTNGGWEWVAPREPGEPPLFWDQDLAAPPPIDLQREPGCRIVVRPTEDGAVVELWIHHACCDAMAAWQVLGELLVSYAAIREGNPAKLSRSVPERLTTRASYGLSRWAWLARLPLDLCAVLGLYEYLCHRPATWRRPSSEFPSAAENDVPAMRSMRLTPDETTRVIEQARRLSVTVNDLLLTAYFQALHAVLVAEQRCEPAAVLRLLIPINMRRPQNRDTPAANLVSLIFLDRCPGRLRTTQRLLGSVHREMAFCKWWGAGLTWLRLLAMGQRRKLRGRRPVSTNAGDGATGVLSNLGDLTRQFPDTWPAQAFRSLKHVEFVPPTVPGAAVTCGVTTWRGTLSLSLRHDPARLDHTTASRVLTELRARLVELTNAPS
jgi:NRPS condensation-like uncharacterized protein